jgi:glycosyltransferase involved in cell wall biosynthesis/predicted Zn-ribbon and HTH transcriptional regulator
MTKLSEANSAFRDGRLERAMRLYVEAAHELRGLRATIGANMMLVRRRFQSRPADDRCLRVCVCGWELAHNAAGRAHTLARLYQEFSDVTIVGSIFPQWGRELWRPIRETTIPHCEFVVDDESRFLDQAIEVVASHPCDVVHLSKPRMPNIFLGVLYKLIWGARVLIDIDDEELAFVGADSPVTVAEHLEAHGSLPGLSELTGRHWTRLAVGLANGFDGVSVSNEALQKRYGGVVVRHARDERVFRPSLELRRRSRKEFQISEDRKVILFYGTPRRHKGLVECAKAIAALGRSDVTFVIVGDFPDVRLKEALVSVKNVDYRFLGDQAFERSPQVLAVGDVTVALQDPKSVLAQFQAPAKLSDALAMGVVVLGSNLPGTEDLAVSGVLIGVTADTLEAELEGLLDDPKRARNLAIAGREVFEDKLSLRVNVPVLRDLAFGVTSPHTHPDHVRVVRSYERLAELGGQALLGPGQSARGVSVIVLTRNGARYLDRLLSGFLARNSHKPVEVLVIDHASTDGTKDIVRLHAEADLRVRYIRRDENYTFAESCNYGVRLAKYTTLLFLNNDIVYTSDVLPEAVSALEDPTVGVVGVRLDDAEAEEPGRDLGVQHLGVEFVWSEERNYHQPRQVRYFTVKEFNRRKANLPSRWAVPAVSGAFLLCRKSDFEAVGGFCEEYGYGLEDVDMCLQMLFSLKKKCLCLTRTSLQHVEGATRKREASHSRSVRQAKNHSVFKARWSSEAEWLSRWEGIDTKTRNLVSAKVQRRLSCWSWERQERFESAIREMYGEDPSRYDNVAVSIVMPVHNRAGCVGMAIDSVIAQSYKNWELIVVDDGSTDDTLGIARAVRDSRVRVVATQHRGVAHARNTGLELASGEVVFYLDSDNVWNPKLLEVVVVFMVVGDLGSAYCGLQLVDDAGKVVGYRGDDFDWEACCELNYVDMNCFAHRRSVSEGVRFDESLRRLVDWDFILRITARTRTAFAPFCGVTYYDGKRGSRITRTVYQGHELQQAFAKIQGKHANPVVEEHQSRLLRPRWCEIVYGSACGLIRDGAGASVEGGARLERLRVAYVLWDFPALSQTFVLNEIRWLVERRRDVKVYYCKDPDKRAELDFDVEAFRVADADALCELLRAHKRNVIHSHFAYPAAALLAFPAATNVGIPFTFMAHAVDICHYENQKRNRVGEVASSPWCLNVITLGESHRRILVESGVPPEKIVLERQSVELFDFHERPLALRNERPVVVSIGRFIEKKGLAYLVAAASRLPGVDFQVFGYGPLEAELRSLADSLGAKNVSFQGALHGKKAVEASLRQADLLATPCVRAANGDMDGLPTVLLEAMSNGLPVVTTDVSNIGDLIQEGFTGFVCRQNDAGDLATTIERALGWEGRQLRQIARRARERVSGFAGVDRAMSTLGDIWTGRRIDIVVVTHEPVAGESWRVTTEIIERIYRFTSMPFRLTVVDNASDREFLAQLRERFGDRRNLEVIGLTENVYCGPATNVGIRSGTSEYVIYVCSREGFVLQHGWEREMVRYMDGRPTVGVAGQLVSIPGFRTGESYLRYPSFEKFRNRAFATQNLERSFRHVQGGVYILRRRAFEEAGPFNEAVPQAGMDVEYSYFLESCGWQLGRVPGLHCVSVKTRPTLNAVLDEFALAAHPLTEKSVRRADSLVARRGRGCNVCGWFGLRFREENQRESQCPECGSTRFSRTAMRFLAETEGLLTRPRTVVVSDDRCLERVIGPLCAGLQYREIRELKDLATIRYTLDPGKFGLVLIDHVPWTAAGAKELTQALPAFLSGGSRMILGDGSSGGSGGNGEGMIAQARAVGIECMSVRFDSYVLDFDWKEIGALGRWEAGKASLPPRGDGR